MINPISVFLGALSKGQGGHDFEGGSPNMFDPGQTVLSPYQRAGQEWDDRIGRATVQAKNWRMAFFACSAATIALAGILAYKTILAPIELWAIPATPDGVIAGNVQRFAAQRYEPTRAQVAADIARWIEWVRVRPADAVKLRADFEKSFVFMGDNAARKMKAYTDKNDPFKDYSLNPTKPRKTVTLTFPKVLPMEGDSYHATWTETVWEHGQPRPPYTVTATFTATAKGQANETLLNLNPAGTTIHDFDWRAD